MNRADLTDRHDFAVATAMTGGTSVEAIFALEAGGSMQSNGARRISQLQPDLDAELGSAPQETHDSSRTTGHVLCKGLLA